jgi:hypothetical protein
VTAEVLAPIANAPKSRNAGIALHRPIRHDPIAVELHDQTSEAFTEGCTSGCTATRRENKHAAA